MRANKKVKEERKVCTHTYIQPNNMKMRRKETQWTETDKNRTIGEIKKNFDFLFGIHFKKRNTLIIAMYTVFITRLLL